MRNSRREYTGMAGRKRTTCCTTSKFLTNRELFHTETLTRQMEAIREGYRQMHKGTLLGSVGGLFVILLLLYLFI